MQANHLDRIPWDERRSPSGKYHSFCQDISLALGGIRNVGTWGGGHPFDLQLRRIPAGASVCPYHAHLAQWEFFYILAGEGEVRTPEGLTRVHPGDVFVHPPREPHQLTNIGTEDLLVYIVAENPLLDGFYYPDSGKWGLRPPNRYFRVTPAHYWEGEETDFVSDSAPPLIIDPADSAFSKLSLVDLPWVPFSSPKGRFKGMSKELSIALGAKRDTPSGLGGHPFDVELSRLEPGQCGCPYHAHSAQWELFFILSGHGTERTADGDRSVGAGDVMLYAPGDAHQLLNTDHDFLDFLVIADNPSADLCHYPDSHRYSQSGSSQMLQALGGTLWDGEE